MNKLYFGDCLDELNELVNRFNENIDDYKSSRYDEENTKIDFIDKFFALLGWDVYNDQGFSEDLREVIREDKLVYRGMTISPDYVFRTGKERQFFVEAKKPSVNIKEGIEPAFQVRRYAYTAKLPVSILTDFEEFAVYDTRIMPNHKDKAGTARIFYCNYLEYEKNLEFIYNTFSKTAVWQGKLKRYTEDNKKKKGTQPIDKAMLATIDGWRNEIARNIALRNKHIDIYQLNEAVQKIIDRIIFLRIAEDRNTEIERSLEIINEQPGIYDRLVKYFDSANNKYNSGLFRIVDWIDSLTIDDKTFKDIIKDLYFPSPYEFKVLPIEILGQIYEQFLGKTIRLTQGHQAKVEEKPEVRKAGGVYYTPQYIVNYIVENTVGKKIENQSPNQINTLRVLDPACGSGSFLVGAFNYLLNYHLEYYTDEKRKAKALKDGAIYQVDADTFRLTIREKRKILLNNIYGVDIDPQAVEVTKLSLLLKLMEGEIVESRGELFLKSISEALLPDLKDNIKCGNSLIGTDFYADKDLTLFDTHEQRKINCFDWEKEFPEVFGIGDQESGISISDSKSPTPDPRSKGFDCVIGNPPYLSFHEGSKKVREYFKKYISSIGKYDQYILFLELSINLSKYSGFTGLIIPNKFIHSNYGEGIKKVILNNQIIEIIDFNDFRVFGDATNYPCIIIINSINSSYEFNYRKVKKLEAPSFETDDIKIIQNQLSTSTWLLIDKKEKKLLDKIFNNKICLNNISYTITQGVRTGLLKTYFNSSDIKKFKIEKELIKKVYHGKNVKRYYINLNLDEDLILFPYKDDLKTPIDINAYPKAKFYLEKSKNELKERKDSGKIFKNINKKWFEYWDSKPICFNSPKIIFPDISKKNNFSIDFNNIGYLNTCYSIILKNDQYYFFILGILNSKVIEYIIKKICPFVRGGYYRYKTRYIEKLPIPLIDFKNEKEKAQHDRMVNLVEQMLEAQKEAHSEKTKTETDKKLLQQRIDIIDKQIDALVYELYGLTEEEIKIVEGID